MPQPLHQDLLIRCCFNFGLAIDQSFYTLSDLKYVSKHQCKPLHIGIQIVCQGKQIQKRIDVPEDNLIALIEP